MNDVTVAVERELRALSEELTAPRPAECLLCYVLRMLGSFRCDGTRRWALHFRDLRVPRATGLEDRLSRRGACCCDCEIFLNGWTLRDHLLVVDPASSDADWPVEQPACRGVGPRSSQPCQLWVVRRRW